MALMRHLLTAREVAALAGRSKSQVNRDATAGRLAVAEQFPGYRGPRLFDADEAATYAQRFTTDQPVEATA